MDGRKRSPQMWLMLAIARFQAFLSEAATAAPTAVMGLPEGEPAAVSCQAGQYLAGVSIRYSGTISGLAPYCAAMQRDGGWEGAGSVNLNTLMSEGEPRSVQVNLFCDRDSFVYGYRGHSHVYGIHGIIHLSLTCLNVRTGALTAIATNYPNGIVGTEWPVALCGGETAATGVFGRVQDAEIIQFGLSCETTRPSAFHAAIAASVRASDEARLIGPPAKSVGRVKQQVLPVVQEAPRSVCDLAREARARNSPAAPGLQAQCSALRKMTAQP